MIVFGFTAAGLVGLLKYELTNVKKIGLHLLEIQFSFHRSRRSFFFVFFPAASPLYWSLDVLVI